LAKKNQNTVLSLHLKTLNGFVNMFKKGYWHRVLFLKRRLIRLIHTVIAAHIVADAWRQYDIKKYADMGIESAIKFPPAPISHNRFSLRAFIKDTQP